MSDGITAIAGVALGSGLTFIWQRMADRRKDRGVRRQIRSMLRLLLSQCVHQTVAEPGVKLSNYDALVTALENSAARDDVATALNDRQADAFYEAVRLTVEARNCAIEYAHSANIALDAWFKLPSSYLGRQEAEISSIAYALIAMGGDDDMFVGSAIPETIKESESWRIFVQDAHSASRLPGVLRHAGNKLVRKRRWRGRGILVNEQGQIIAREMEPGAVRLKKFLDRF